MLAGRGHGRSWGGGEYGLTRRELEVLELAAQGCTVQRTADILGLAHSTVDHHRRLIFLKLDVSRISEAVAVALREGLIRAPR